MMKAKQRRRTARIPQHAPGRSEPRADHPVDAADRDAAVRRGRLTRRGDGHPMNDLPRLRRRASTAPPVSQGRRPPSISTNTSAAQLRWAIAGRNADEARSSCASHLHTRARRARCGRRRRRRHRRDGRADARGADHGRTVRALRRSARAQLRDARRALRGHHRRNAVGAPHDRPLRIASDRQRRENRAVLRLRLGAVGSRRASARRTLPRVRARRRATCARSSARRAASTAARSRR